MKKPTREELCKVSRETAREGLERILERIPPGFAEGLPPALTARGKNDIEIESE